MTRAAVIKKINTLPEMYLDRVVEYIEKLEQEIKPKKMKVEICSEIAGIMGIAGKDIDREGMKEERVGEKAL